MIQTIFSNLIYFLYLDNILDTLAKKFFRADKYYTIKKKQTTEIY